MIKYIATNKVMMHLRKRSVPSGKTNRFYYSICQTFWDREAKRPRERTLIYLGKEPIITEEQAKEKGFPIKELEALAKKSDLVIAVRTDKLADRLKHIISLTKKRIPASVWQDFKRLGFHLKFMMSNNTTDLAAALPRTSFRPFAGSSANKLVIRLSPEAALLDDERLIQCMIAEEIAHQYAQAKRLRREDIQPKGRIEEEVWILVILRKWGFSEEEVKHFASLKNWLAYATREWGDVPLAEGDCLKSERSQTSGGAPRSRAGGACEAPPHKNGTRSLDPSLNWIRMPFIPTAELWGITIK
jgi:hypothetical protein